MALVLPHNILYDKGGQVMKEFLVFIHEGDDSMVTKVEVIRARNKREALKMLQQRGFKKRKF